jgi:hypothetical protein
MLQMRQPDQRHEVSNWQLAQAQNARELHDEPFRGIALAPRLDDCVDEIPPTFSPTSLVTESGMDEAASGTRNRRPPRLPIPAAQPPAAVHPFATSIASSG